MASQSIISIPESAYYETSHKQRRDWSYSQSLKRTNNVYKLRIIETIDDLNVGAFEMAMGIAIRANDSLRTNFVKKDGCLVQVVQAYDGSRYQVRYRDCRFFLGEWRCRKFIKAEYRRIVDYAREPLISTLVLRRNRNRYTVAIFVEHIIFDAASSDILRNEIGNYYSRILNGEVLSTARKAYQLKDYVAWRNRRVTDEANICYWQKALARNEFTIDFECFYRSCGIQNFRKTERADGKFRGFIGDGIASKIDEMAKMFKTAKPFFMTTVYVLLMSVLFQQKHLLVSKIFMGRERSAFTDLLACCAEPVFLFITVDPDLNVQDTIRMIEETFFSSIERPFPWGDIQENPAPGRYLTQINCITSKVRSKGSANPFQRIHTKEKSSVRRPYSLLALIERVNYIEFLFDYSLEVYSQPMVQRIFEKYLALLEGISRNPGVKIADLDEIILPRGRK